jgi:hypothetical protein
VIAIALLISAEICEASYLLARRRRLTLLS